MRLGYKARKRISLLVLVLGVPAYIVAAVTIMNALGRPPIWVEFLVYLVLGVIWAIPLRAVFRGVGQPDPDAGDGR